MKNINQCVIENNSVIVVPEYEEVDKTKLYLEIAQENSQLNEALVITDQENLEIVSAIEIDSTI